MGAATSTIDSSLHATATVILTDVDAEYLRWVAALGTASTVILQIWGTFWRQPATDRWYASLACPLQPNLIGISATCTMLCVVVGLNCLAGTRPNDPEQGFSP